MVGAVVEIWVSDAPGAPMRSMPHARLESGCGIVGDRYHLGIGTFSAKLAGTPDSEITLIASEEIDRANSEMATRFESDQFRRNIVTADVDLNALVGEQFTVGDVALEGIRLCEPCVHLAGLLDREEVVRIMAHRAGLRARIVQSGDIRVGDPIRQSP